MDQMDQRQQRQTKPSPPTPQQPPRPPPPPPLATGFDGGLQPTFPQPQQQQRQPEEQCHQPNLMQPRERPHQGDQGDQPRFRRPSSPPPSISHQTPGQAYPQGQERQHDEGEQHSAHLHPHLPPPREQYQPSNPHQHHQHQQYNIHPSQPQQQAYLQHQQQQQHPEPQRQSVHAPYIQPQPAPHSSSYSSPTSGPPPTYSFQASAYNTPHHPGRHGGSTSLHSFSIPPPVLPTPGSATSASPAKARSSVPRVAELGGDGGGGGTVEPLMATENMAGDDDEQNDAAESGEGSARKRQKRCKPTLSCRLCTERKVKCDRGRPHCIACVNREATCEYAPVANRLQENYISVSNSRRITVPPKKKTIQQQQNLGSVARASLATGEGGVPGASSGSTAVPPAQLPSRSFMSLSKGLLSNLPYSVSSASNVFGIGAGHPFANYWTCSGGLKEVLMVMPEEEQAGSLVRRYFECVDPVYPMIHRQTFYADYAAFWAAKHRDEADGRQQSSSGGGGDGGGSRGGSSDGGHGSSNSNSSTDVEPDFVALLLIVMALGMQFMPASSQVEKQNMAEFYASGSNQALRVFSYLNTVSIRSIQAMVLIVYFLINNNHCSDGWAFAGIIIRQAYAMGLHRDPNLVAPNATVFEKHERRKLWQAVLHQDTFLTVLLSLPPSATHHDVSVDDLTDDAGSIAMSDPTDMAYLRSSWTLANLVQRAICSPRSLDLDICTSARQKTKLLTEFRAVYRSFPDVFRNWDADKLKALARHNPRVVRQTLFLTSNYFHNMMLVNASCSSQTGSGSSTGGEGEGGGGGGGQQEGTSNPTTSTTETTTAATTTTTTTAATATAAASAAAAETAAATSPPPPPPLPPLVPSTTEASINIKATLDSAHDAIASFFLLCDIFPDDAGVWWVFNHRAFLEALCIGDVLQAVAAQGTNMEGRGQEAIFARAKADIARMIAIMEAMGSGEQGSGVARTRVEVLSQFL